MSEIDVLKQQDGLKQEDVLKQKHEIDIAKMKNRNKIYTALIAGVFSVVSIIGTWIVTNNANKKMIPSNDGVAINLNVDVNKLLAENKGLSEENSRLRELESKYNALLEENLRLSAENSTLSEVAAKYDPLFEQHEALSAENVQLRDTAAKYDSLLEEHGALLAEKAQLRDEASVPEIVWLSDLKCIARSGDGWVEWPSGKQDNIGNTYGRGGLYAGGGDRTHSGHSITYLINAKHTYFFGILVLSNNSRVAGNYTINIYGEKENGEETLVYSSPRMAGGSVPLPFVIKISGYATIRIERIAEGSVEIGLVNAGFY